MPKHSWLVVFAVLAFQTQASAAIFISHEARGNTPLGRAAASTLDRHWRENVKAGSPLVAFSQPDNLAEERLLTPTATSGVLEFPLLGLNVAWSFRRMDEGVLFGVQQSAAPTYSTELGPESYSPYPDRFIGAGLEGANYTTVIDGKTASGRCAVLFEFSQPVTSFGFFVGDLESRPNGTLAELRLFDSGNQLMNSGRTTLRPTGVLLGENPGVYDVDSTETPADHRQWGDNTTQFIGFYHENPVSRALLVVGDESLNGEGLLEHIVFFGATAVGRVLGDFDFDHVADGRDFLAWQRGQSLTPHSPVELAEWQAAYNLDPALTAALAVPEPSTLLMILSAVLTLPRRLPRC